MNNKIEVQFVEGEELDHNSTGVYHILFLEDNPDDVELMEHELTALVCNLDPGV